MSAERENGYFTDGMAEEIINALTTIKALRVASRTSSFAFKGTTEDIRQVGKKLDVATVLEGSVRKAGNKLRITAQLVNVADGYQLWSQRYDRDMEDVFAIQDEIAQNIVKALRVILSEDEKRAIEKVPTANVEAYDCYLRGRQFFHQFRKQSLEFARQMFNKAIEIDPTYALAYAGVADCCSVLYTNFDATRRESRERRDCEPASAGARTAARRSARRARSCGFAAWTIMPKQRRNSRPRWASTRSCSMRRTCSDAHCSRRANSRGRQRSSSARRSSGPEDYVVPGLLRRCLRGTRTNSRRTTGIQAALDAATKGSS